MSRARRPIANGAPARRGRRLAVAVAGAAVLAGAVVAWTRYTRTLRDAHRRVAGRTGRVVTRAGGRMEYAVAGDGPPLLMLHGTGGGFDQGLAMPGGLVERGLSVVAPSRFGYLGSDFPDDPSPERQADALVELLDHLGLRRAVVAGGSAGALSAMQLALRHPARCAGLVLLVPAANVHGRDPVSMSPALEWTVRRLLESDLLYWLALRTIPGTLVGTLLATDPALLAQVSPQERHRADAILESMRPIAPRARGMLNDARLAGRPAPVEVERIGMPALLLSVEDDRFGTAATARDLAARMPRARLVVYPSGGHVWLGHDAEVADEIARFVREVSG